MILRIFRKKRTFAILLIMLLLVLFYNSNWMGRWMYPVRYEEMIRSAAKAENVDPYLLAAIVRAESNYVPDKTSKKGAVGLMQLMPETANWIAEGAGYATPVDSLLTDPWTNIDIGAKYVRTLTAQYAAKLQERSGKEDRNALIAAAYNAGPGNVGNWLAGGDWTGLYADAGAIPYGETRHFVQRIIYYYNKYEQYYEEWLAEERE